MAFSNPQEAFDKMKEVFDAKVAHGVDAVFQWDLLGDNGGAWYVVVKNGACEFHQGKHPSPQVAQTSSVETFLALVNLEKSGMAAFMSGKLKVKGNFMLAQKIPAIFPL